MVVTEVASAVERRRSPDRAKRPACRSRPAGDRRQRRERNDPFCQRSSVSPPAARGRGSRLGLHRPERSGDVGPGSVQGVARRRLVDHRHQAPARREAPSPAAAPSGRTLTLRPGDQPPGIGQPGGHRRSGSARVAGSGLAGSASLTTGAVRSTGGDDVGGRSPTSVGAASRSGSGSGTAGGMLWRPRRLARTIRTTTTTARPRPRATSRAVPSSSWDSSPAGGALPARRPRARRPRQRSPARALPAWAGDGRRFGELPAGAEPVRSASPSRPGTGTLSGRRASRRARSRQAVRWVGGRSPAQHRSVSPPAWDIRRGHSERCRWSIAGSGRPAALACPAARSTVGQAGAARAWARRRPVPEREPARSPGARGRRPPCARPCRPGGRSRRDRPAERVCRRRHRPRRAPALALPARAAGVARAGRG